MEQHVAPDDQIEGAVPKAGEVCRAPLQLAHVAAVTKAICSDVALAERDQTSLLCYCHVRTQRREDTAE